MYDCWEHLFGFLCDRNTNAVCKDLHYLKSKGMKIAYKVRVMRADGNLVSFFFGLTNMLQHYNRIPNVNLNARDPA